jgi:hypothetical protein
MRLPFGIAAQIANGANPQSAKRRGIVCTEVRWTLGSKQETAPHPAPIERAKSGEITEIRCAFQPYVCSSING